MNSLAIKALDSMVSAIKFNGALKVNLSRNEDPTGQARNRANLNKKIKVRLAHAEQQVIKLFNDIPRTSKTEKNLSLNQETFTTYDYDLSPFEQDQFEAQIQAIINFWLLLGQNESKPINYYSDPNVEEAYRTGTLEVVRDLNADLAKLAVLGGVAGAFAALLPRSFDANTILFSQSYLDTVLGYQNDMFYQLKGLSEKTSSQVYERISSGMKSNKSPRNIIKDIKKRFGVSLSGAKRIVNTEINRVYNNSVMDAIDFINNNTNIKAAGRHKSALLPTTRKLHADRHNKLYTTAQQLRWWEIGSNRINCYCSFIIVILDNDNNVILDL
jgi:hypothetical protein